MKKIIFLLLVFCCGSMFSQEETIVKGRIIFSSLNMSEINIINLSTNYGTVNNAAGEFEIAVAIGDQLLFSSVQYEPKYVQITPEIFDKRWFQVKLEPALNELEPVTISNIDLTGDLIADSKVVSNITYFNNNSFGLPMPGPKMSFEDRRIYTATTSGGLIPLDLILNALSGRLKRLKRLKSYAELDEVVGKGLNSMEKDFFILECGIPEAYISSFLYFCAENPNFENLITDAPNIELVPFFKKQAVLFKEKRGWLASEER